MPIPRGTGTGFLWDDRGNVVTNFHVIQAGQTARVTLADQTTWKAALVGAFPDRDLAVLRIDAPKEKLKPIAVGVSRDLQVGQKVYAIGKPIASFDDLLNALEQHQTGDTVTLSIVRGDKRLEQPVRLGLPG